MDFGFEVLKHVSYICSLYFESLSQAPVKRKLLHKLGRKKRSFDVDGENAAVTEGEPTLLGSISGGRVQDINFSPADFATVETEMGGGGGKRRMNLYQKHRSKSRYLFKSEIGGLRDVASFLYNSFSAMLSGNVRI